MASPLLKLPLELRELVYEHLFSTFTIRHGLDQKIKDHRTALLQTCKQLHQEAWRFLPLTAHFHFRGTEAMLDTLLSLDQAIVTRIRHIRVKSFPFPLYANGKTDYYTTYHFSNALALLPGLHLDQLIVEDSYHGYGLVDTWRDVVTYFDIEALLRCDGWRELIYVTPNTDFLTSGYDHRRKRVAQPSHWDKMLQERDGGEETGAKVEMFVTPEKGEGSGVMRAWSALPGHEVIVNPRLNGPEQEVKGEVRVVARRGKRAGVVVKGFRENKSWREMKNGGFERDDWDPYYNDMADAVGWIYGGWGRRLQMATRALN